MARHMESIALAALPAETEDTMDNEQDDEDQCVSVASAVLALFPSSEQTEPVDLFQLYDGSIHQNPSSTSQPFISNDELFHSSYPEPEKWNSNMAGPPPQLECTLPNQHKDKGTPFTFPSSFDVHAIIPGGPYVSRDANIYNSPIWDGSAFPDSELSSPTLEEWLLPPPQTFSGSHNPWDDPDSANKTTVRKPIGPRPSKVRSDYSTEQRMTGTSSTSDESLRFLNGPSLMIDTTARDHALYQNVTVYADGLYHCRWEGKEGCQYKAEKLKCNYEYVYTSLQFFDWLGI
jgi:hypothetical protein